MLFELLESIGNRVFGMDPETIRQLGALAGKVICLDITGIDKRVYMLPTQNGVRICPSYETEPDVTLTGSLAAFARLGLAGADIELFAKRDIKVIGDTELGQRFQRILEGLDIDWEEVLSRYVGDIPAYRIGSMAREANRWGQDVRATVRANTSEYLQEEARILAPESRVLQFMGQVDELRSRVDRLDKRIQRLLSQHK